MSSIRDNTADAFLIADQGPLKAILSSYPTAPGQTIVTRDMANIFNLTSGELKDLLLFTRCVAVALEEATGTRRVALASDGATLNLIPLHGLDETWVPVTNIAEEFHDTYPGFLTSKSAPKLFSDSLDAVTARITSASGLTQPYNTTFLGDTTDNNLFARVVRGDLEQWRIWEDSEHVAFLTPFADTLGFTVLIPRAHLHSDVFKLDDTAYERLIDAAYQVANVLRKALGIERVGLFFEGYEIDYTHAKLIPVHALGGATLQEKDTGEAPYSEIYPGYITTQPGPKAELGPLQSFAQDVRRKL